MKTDIDHAVVARVFLTVRKATKSTVSAMRVALATYRALAPGLKGIGMELSVERLARSFELTERSLREDGYELSRVELTERALREVLTVPNTTRIPDGERKIRVAVAQAILEHGVTEEQLLGSRGPRWLSKIRNGIWLKLVGEGVGPNEIGRWFGRDHSTVTKCVQSLWSETERRGPVSAADETRQAA
jgi:hypothetical protein